MMQYPTLKRNERSICLWAFISACSHWSRSARCSRAGPGAPVGAVESDRQNRWDL